MEIKNGTKNGIKCDNCKKEYLDDDAGCTMICGSCGKDICNDCLPEDAYDPNQICPICGGII